MEMDKYIAVGEKLGLAGKELRDFIREQQNMYREERAKEREVEKQKQEQQVQQAQAQVEAQAQAQAHELETMKLQIELERVKAKQDTSTSEVSSVRASNVLPKLPKFDARSDEIDSYIERFERIAESSKLDSGVWAISLGTLLTGKALEIYSSLPLPIASDYSQLKLALLKAFNSNAEGFRRKFKESAPMKAETGPQYMQRLQMYLKRWLELSGVEDSYKGMFDFVLQDQFLGSVHDSLRVFLNERRESVGGVEELARLADSYIEAHSCSLGVGKSERPRKLAGSEPNKGFPDSGKSLSPGIVGRKPQCFQCKELGHLKEHCPYKHRSQTALKCFICDKVGHIAKHCREKRSQDHGKFEKCSSCSHEEDKLPISLGKVNGHSVKVLRDTGCTSAVVNRSLVCEDQLTGRFAKCSLVDGTVRHFPWARVFVDTSFFKGCIKAMCVDSPTQDLVIGNLPGVKSCVDKELTADENKAEPKVHTGKSSSEYVDTHSQSSDLERVQVVAAVETRAAKKKGKEKGQGLKTTLHVGKDVSIEDLCQMQRADKTLNSCRALKAKGKFEGTGKIQLQFYEHDNVLHRKVWGYRKGLDSEVDQVLVPKILRVDVMRLAHESVMAGHLGSKKTLERILSSFYWPGIGADVKRFCRSCDICQRTVPKGRVGKVPLGSLPVIDRVFDRVSVDLIGPLAPASDRGHRYILVLVDHASRYPEAVPLRSIDTEAVAEALLEIFSRVGFPREVLSDRGTQFTSDLMQQVAKLVNVRQIFTTPYNPKCNGLVERMNGTLKTMLRRMCAEQPRDWDRYIPAALFAYREVPQASTGFSPFEILYGRTVRGPVQILKELWTQPTDSEVRTTYEYVLDLRQKLEHTCELAREHLRKSKEDYKHHYDKRARPRDLKVGERVLLLLPSKANKLELQWQGPYPVLEKVGDLDYRIKKGRVGKLYHINLLKRYDEREGCDIKADNTANEEVVATVVEVSGEDQDLELFARHGDPVSEVIVSSDLSPGQSREVRKLVSSYSDVLSDLPGSTPLVEHHIETSTSEPVKGPVYSIPYALRPKVEEEIDFMLKEGIIEPSFSPYNSGVVLVRKENGSVRLCSDFRKLNAVTKFDSEPMCEFEDITAKLSAAKYLSKFDCTKGFWQIPMEESSKEKTAFSVPSGHYHYLKMPFGLVNSPATFNRLMRSLLKGLPGVVHFVDDVLVYSKSWEEHMKTLELFLQSVRQSNLTLKPSKSCLGFGRLEYLGHIVGQGNICTDPKKVEKVVQADRPTTKKEVRSFLGLVGFYGKFIPNFSDLAYPLTSLTKKGQPDKLVWKEEHERSFQSLKDALVREPVLRLPDLSKPMILQTDASATGVGAVLLQEHEGVAFPVAYGGKKLLPREQRYSTIERECLAIVFGLKRFEKYLYGQEFVLRTDHQPLAYIDSMKNKNNRVLRWSLYLQNYRYRVQFVKGSQNVIADYLSRSSN